LCKNTVFNPKKKKKKRDKKKKRYPTNRISSNPSAKKLIHERGGEYVNKLPWLISPQQESNTVSVYLM
jgi:hypothetical protein